MELVSLTEQRECPRCGGSFLVGFEKGVPGKRRRDAVYCSARCQRRTNYERRLAKEERDRYAGIVGLYGGESSVTPYDGIVGLYGGSPATPGGGGNS